LLVVSRYVYVESTVPAILAVARGHREPADSIADGSVEVFGDPALTGLLPTWFLPADPPSAGAGDVPVRPMTEGQVLSDSDAAAVAIAI
jgi:hypothetical protein